MLLLTIRISSINESIAVIVSLVQTCRIPMRSLRGTRTGIINTHVLLSIPPAARRIITGTSGCIACASTHTAWVLAINESIAVVVDGIKTALIVRRPFRTSRLTSIAVIILQICQPITVVINAIVTSAFPVFFTRRRVTDRPAVKETAVSPFLALTECVTVGKTAIGTDLHITLYD